MCKYEKCKKYLWKYNLFSLFYNVYEDGSGEQKNNWRKKTPTGYHEPERKWTSVMSVVMNLRAEIRWLPAGTGWLFDCWESKSVYSIYILKNIHVSVLFWVCIFFLFSHQIYSLRIWRRLYHFQKHIQGFHNLLGG